MSRRYTEAEIAEVWERRQGGELSRSIGRRLGRSGASIRTLVESTGEPPHASRSARASPVSSDRVSVKWLDRKSPTAKISSSPSQLRRAQRASP